MTIQEFATGGPVRGGDFDRIYFAIPADGRGPSFGPVLDRAVAQAAAKAMPGYVIGIPIDYLDFAAVMDAGDE
jgi:hypothetical protein